MAECNDCNDLFSIRNHPIETDSIACRFFQKGVCKKGENCNFSHSVLSSQDIHKSQIIRNVVEEQCLRNLSTTGEGNICISAEQDCAEPFIWSNPENTLGGSFDHSLKWNADQWVKAKEFIPGQPWKSLECTKLFYCHTSSSSRFEDQRPARQVSCTIQDTPSIRNVDCFNLSSISSDVPEHSVDLCSFCDFCDAMLPSDDVEGQQKHIVECIKEHEKEMELSFAVQRSQDKTCGICMDVVWDKAVENEQRFGILSDCNHVFCLECIRKWRSAKQFENKIVRACPECRIKSNFVTPSRYWMEDKNDKKKLIEEYKSALSKKPCKYFDKGKGECPFNDKCFYLHAYPDGRIASPRPRTQRPRRSNIPESDDLDDLTNHLMLGILDNWGDGQLGERLENLIYNYRYMLELSFLPSSDDEDDEDDDDNEDSDVSTHL